MMSRRLVFRSWLLAGLAMGGASALYLYDNHLKDQSQPGSAIHWWLEIIEIAVFLPAVGLGAFLLSENNRLQQVALRLRIEAEQEDRLLMLGRIAASVAHEIRNPLQNLRLIAEEMHQHARSDDRPLIERAHVNISRLDQAVRLVYELARLPRAREDADTGRLDLRALIEAELKELGNRSQTAIAVNHASSSEPVVVIGRESALRIVFANLLRNAVEAADDQVITISYRQVDKCWACSIANPGNLPLQARDLTSHKPDGLGVGLFIVRHLIVSAGGTFSLGANDGIVVADVILPGAEA